jgi:putative transcriptional regulator
MLTSCQKRHRLLRLRLGLLDEPEASALRAHVGSCPVCTAEHQRLDEAYHAVGASAAALVAADLAGLRTRMLASAERELRLDHLVPLVAHHLQLDDEQARQVLARVDQPSTWGRGPGPGVALQRLTVGARCQSTLTNLIRLEGGAHFPEHGHLGDEVVVVLQGQMREASGVVHRSGAEVLSGTSTEHGFDALEGPDLVCLVVVEGGVRFGDRVFRA